jgi:AAA family ATP:ADP antiporter
MSESQASTTADFGESSWRRTLHLLGVDVRPGEGAVAALLFLFFFLAITFQYVSKAVRQSKFMDALGAEMLPIVWLLLALCAIPAIMLYNRAVDRFPRHHVIAGTCGAVAASVTGFALIIQSDAAWVPIAFYIFVSIAYVLIVSQFWAYSNFILNPRQGKRLFGFIGAGGLAGGLTGASIASLVSGVAGTQMTLLVSAAILMLAIGAVYLIHRMVPQVDDDASSVRSSDKLAASKGGLEAILASRHLRLIAGLMFVTVVVANIIDLQFNWAMVEALPDLGEGERLDALTGGYGNFYVVMSISALVFQLLFTSRIHRRLGIGFAMRVLPVMMLLGTTGIFAAATIVPGLLLNVCRLLKIGENGLRYSLDQATRELLFFPVPTGDRLKAKAYIDVFVQRSAKAGAGLLLLPVTFELMTPVQAGWISIALIGVWLGVTVALRRQYVESFREGLRRRSFNAAVPIDLSDATALEVVVQTLGSSDQRQVMHGLELLEHFGKVDLVPPVLVRHDSADVRRKTLALLTESNRFDAIPMIEGVLADDDPEVRSAALHAIVSLQGDTAATNIVEKLNDPSAELRSAAVASILAGDQGPGRLEASEALKRMVASAELRDRCAATDVIGELKEPGFQEDLVQLLYDSDIAVQRDAIRAVRSRVERGGNNPIFVPTLISLTRDRRLKHEARAALVNYGESVIPALVYFMNDTEEQLWVRRALPKTVAQIGGKAAADALLGCLDVRDQFMRSKVMESLQWMRSHEPGIGFDDKPVAEEIRHEARLYYLALTDLVSTAGTDSFDYKAPLVQWKNKTPLLLQRMFADRMQGCVDNIFRLLSLIHPVADVRAASQSLMSGDQQLRSHALEYVDNALHGRVHQAVFAVLGDETLEDKLGFASAKYHVVVQPADNVLRRLVVASQTEDEAAHWLGSAAIQAIVELEITELYPQLIEVSRRADDSLVKETAVWAGNRLGLEPA